MVTIGPLNKTQPATQFWMDAYASSSNSSGTNVHIVLRAYNGPGGTTGSQYNGSGEHVGTIDGVGGAVVRASTPFLPGGYQNGQLRWEHHGDIFVGHAGAIDVTVRMRTTYGNVNESHTATLSLAAVASVPPAPTQHQPSNITPTSMRVTFSGNGDGGRPIIGWELWRATDPNFTQNVVSITSSGTSDVGGLTPGTTYYWKSRGRNELGLGPFSNTVSQATLPAVAPGVTITPSLSGTSATITLTPPGGATGVTKYRVERRIGSGAVTAVEQANSPIVIPGLSPGQTYQWRASAFFGTYQSPMSDWTPVQQPNPNTNPGDYFDGNSAPRTDITFAWLGTANLSASQALGVPVRGWYGPNGPVQRVTGGRSGGFYGRYTFLADQSGPGGASSNISPDVGVFVPVEENATYVASVYVRPSRTQRLVMDILWWDEVDVFVGLSTGAPIVVDDTTGWTRVWVSDRAPLGAAKMSFRLYDTAGDDWSAWLSGDTLDIDDAMVSLATLFPYFSGDTPDSTEFDYEWLGLPNESVSARNELPAQFVDLLADPDCPPLPQPPTLPSIPNECIDETGTWRRYLLTIPATEVRLWSSTLPTLLLRTGSQAERQVRIRYYANPDGLAPEEVIEDGWESEQILTYIPPLTEIRLDGVTQRVTAAVGGNAPVSGNRLLYGTGGVPATWPELRCGIGYALTLDVPLDAPAGNLETRILVTQRM
jgi:hypothetical protein